MYCLDSCPVYTDYVAAADDSQLSASSTHSDRHSVAQSRLNTLGYEANPAGSWSALTIAAGEWIQIDLLEPRHIDRIATQGRNDMTGPYHVQRVTSYKVSYSNDGSTFNYVLNFDGSERVFAGNTDSDTIVANVFDAVQARYIRLVVETWNSHASLRWGVFGCGNDYVYVPSQLIHVKY